MQTRAWGMFLSGDCLTELVIKPAVWGEQTDKEILDRTMRDDIPEVLDYLETQLPADGFIFGSVSIADISIACFFRNAAFSRYQVDAARWPRTAAFVERVLKLESFEKLKTIEDRLRRTPLAQHRDALIEMGAPVMQETCAGAKPCCGMMRIDYIAAIVAFRDPCASGKSFAWRNLGRRATGSQTAFSRCGDG